MWWFQRYKQFNLLQKWFITQFENKMLSFFSHLSKFKMVISAANWFILHVLMSIFASEFDISLPNPLRQKMRSDINARYRKLRWFQRCKHTKNAFFCHLLSPLIIVCSMYYVGFGTILVHFSTLPCFIMKRYFYF